MIKYLLGQLLVHALRFVYAGVLGDESPPFLEYLIIGLFSSSIPNTPPPILSVDA